MESGGPLSGARFARAQGRSRARRRRMPGLRGDLQGQARGTRRRPAASPRRSSATRRSTICSAGSISYAGLVYSGDTGDPVRTKFYGDVQERLTAATTNVLFFTLELNRIDDAVLERAMQDPALGHYRPWIEDVRKEKPYQLEDRVEQLFHEKSVTGYGAWNRLFDETMASLRFKVDGEDAADRAARSTSCRIPTGARRKAAAEALAAHLQGQPAGLHARSPTRSPRTRRFPTAGAASRTSRRRAISPTGSSRRWSTRWSPRCARPIRACRTATTR